ncbi:transcriptional regulator with XRE-family HTH domain [Sphingomonas kaistensis]|uniref:Transcriptional regulator with XRE-family HTH domain n=1 Tax=Sphingomonas kaistensis TaxID=298708 RepID=A0A7X6BGG0_9SPHN|nr:helix-turn-helix transcriptional regulator [Sphingomonas kaistensis]NJC05420.1 transcriptional regulator with XRE-family HTH domain [Sphingomonas kaistensis]
MTAHDSALGTSLREWRQRRRLSQLDLAAEAEISSRHLSFIETGRTAPSRAMVLRIADTLDLPLRERNALLLAAGFAPDHGERSLDDPALDAARAAVERIIDCHMPFPALAVDRCWNLLHANPAVLRLLDGAADHLLGAGLNVLRLSLHPEGLAPRIVNLAQWKAHLLHRLGQQLRASADPRLDLLLQELRSYPAPASERPPSASDFVSPLVLETPAGRLSLLSTTTIFGTANDVTLSEITIESFFPVNEASAAILRSLGSGAQPG